MNAKQNAGFSLIEVLVTIVILVVGLLGLAGLQGWATTSQMESYQRAQAVILLQDIQDRINANRANAAAYVGNYAGSASCPAAGTTLASQDVNAWCNALQGAAESQSGVRVGAMIGAQGCITQITAPATGVASQYLIEVAWQGLNKTATPSSNCGKGQYGDETRRRVISLPVNIANLN